MLSRKILILGAVLFALGATSADSVLADTEMFFTGGGVIRDGNGSAAKKITFSVDMFSIEGSQPEGRIQFQFHKVGSPDLNKSRFIAYDFDEIYINMSVDQDLVPCTFIKVWAYGQLNGEDGWSVVARFTDYGNPPGSKVKAGTSSDAVRIQLFAPGKSESVYDTALDYPHEQGWRALLDGGNVSFYLLIDTIDP